MRMMQRSLSIFAFHSRISANPLTTTDGPRLVDCLLLFLGQNPACKLLTTRALTTLGILLIRALRHGALLNILPTSVMTVFTRIAQARKLLT